MKRWMLPAVCLVFAAAVCCYLIRMSYTKLTVREYEVSIDSVETPVKFVILADLHDNTFGENNERLIAAVKAQAPDAVLLAGDLLSRSSQGHEAVLALVKELAAIAPVYSSIGNHETDYMIKNGDSLLQEMEAAGAVLLDRNWCDIELAGQKLRIGGLYALAYHPDQLTCGREEMSDALYDFLDAFQQTDVPKVMISHRPESFILGEASKTWDVDLVVSGHLHGGQIVLPFIGGIWAPEQGLFPDYLHGVYQKDLLQIFITSGLGSKPKSVPRFNNPPELAVVTLVPEASAGN